MRVLDQLMAGEKHICLLGTLYPINQMHRSGIFGLSGGTRGPFLVAAAMVMWVLLAIGHWPLAVGCLGLLLARILHNSRNSIHVHTHVFFSGLKYLDWSKFYSGCPDTPNKI